MENQSFQRHVAYKLNIANVLSSSYHKVEGADPNFLKSGEREISRINVISAVVDKIDGGTYSSIVLDDSTGTISARLFEQTDMIKDIAPGDFVNVVARPREYNEEKYLLIEAITKVNPLWGKVRKIELERKEIGVISNGNVESGSNEKSSQEDQQEQTIEHEAIVEEVDVQKDEGDSSSMKVLQYIKEKDEGEGVSIESIIQETVSNAEEIVEMLLKEGDIFEIKPGKVKVLE